MQAIKKTLKNGIRVIAIPIPNNKTVTALILVEAGSKFETKRINGVSHFLEHMCFKGTKNRPTPLKIAVDLDKIGAQTNAFTGQEYTGYYAKAHSKHQKHILDILADVYLNPVFDPAEIEKEKGVICDELSMYEDMPMHIVGESFIELLYKGQPAGWPIGGTKKIIRRLNRKDIVSYRKKHYVAKGTVVVISGDINSKEVFKKVEKAFSSIARSKKYKKISTYDSQAAPRLSVLNKKTDQTHLILGVRTFGTKDKRNPILDVLAVALGGGMSSRLFQRIRDEMGVGYYIKAGSDSYTDHGYFAVSAGVDSKRIIEVLGAIIEELDKIKNVGIGKEELKKVIDYIGGRLYLGLESSDDLAEYYGFQEMIKKSSVTPQQYMELIRSVDNEAIQSLAKSIFVNSGLNVALIGPIDKKKKNNIKKTLFFKG